ncbi:MAG: hypothetical protein HFI67_06320 [Lachnospiraceae bacterium]|jgi:hypothetical protein|nr:hypothetical protein [Lachnospiraceae bacterium]
MIKYVGQVVAEVLLGIGLWGLAGVIVVLAVWGITDGILYGFLLGLLLAAGYFIHMSITLETSVDMMEEKSAKNHAVRAYLIRVAAGAAVLVAAWWSGWFNMLAILAGLFTLKLGVYTRPLIHKAFRHLGFLKDPED